MCPLDRYWTVLVNFGVEYMTFDKIQDGGLVEIYTRRLLSSLFMQTVKPLLK